MSLPLPQVIQELIDVAGADAAWTLVRAWGGRNVYIPPSVRPDHWLAQLVGLPAAESICRHYRDNTTDGYLGRRLLIPMASRAQGEEAWAKVLSGELSLRQTAELMGDRKSVV